MNRTPEQEAAIREKRKAYFGPERNLRRRERYQSDPEYRDRELGRGRVRADKNLKPSEDPRRFLGRLGGEAVACQIYAALPDGSDPTPKLKDCDLPMELAFRTEDLARVLGRSTNLLHRWRKDDKLPAAIHWGLMRSENATSTFLAHVQVYLLPEVEAMIEVLGEHFLSTPYYHSSHVETRDKLFEAVAQVRKNMTHVRQAPRPEPQPAVA